MVCNKRMAKKLTGNAAYPFIEWKWFFGIQMFWTYYSCYHQAVRYTFNVFVRYGWGMFQISHNCFRYLPRAFMKLDGRLVGCVLWHIKHNGLFNAKSSLHIYIKMKLDVYMSAHIYLSYFNVMIEDGLVWY